MYTLLFFFLFVQSASAHASLTQPIDFSKHQIVKVSLEAVEKSFVPSPAKGSKIEQDDFAELLTWQSKRTDAQCKIAVDEAAIATVYSAFGPDYKILDAKQTQELAKIMSTAVNEEIDYIRSLKDYYKRPRPYDANSQIHPCAKKETTLAYPSGHAAISRFIAHALSAADPANSKKYFARADEVALNRVLGGVHHPSDIAAGKVFADYFWQQCEQSSEFHKSLLALTLALKKI